MTCDNYQHNDLQESVDLMCANAGLVECYERLTNDLPPGCLHHKFQSTDLECKKKTAKAKEKMQNS